jgi:hypothetical protein
LCFPALEKEAKKQRMIVTENIVDDKEEAWVEKNFTNG